MDVTQISAGNFMQEVSAGDKIFSNDLTESAVKEIRNREGVLSIRVEEPEWIAEFTYPDFENSFSFFRLKTEFMTKIIMTKNNGERTFVIILKK
jgi:hypothetical protein